MSLSRRAKIAGGVGIGIVVVVAGGYGHHAYTQWQNTQDELPVFTEIPPGPRAPKGDTAVLGLRVGSSTRADVDAWAQARGVSCSDTSMRALMEQKRVDVRREMAKAKAEGRDPDGVTGASLANYHSKKERNPQVRLACDDVVIDGEKGRVLVVLDAASLPVRYVSFQRYLPDADAAIASYRAAAARMTTRFGASTGQTGPEPDGGEVPPLTRREWRFSDLRGEVQLMGHGQRGIEVRELLEVPWPVRPDAPTLP